MRTNRVLALTLATTLAVATACNGDDDAEPADTATTAPVTAVTPETTGAATDPPTTSTTLAPTTTLPPTTTTPTPTTSAEDALEAEIAADYLAADAAQYDLVHAPTLDQLAERVALVAAPGSAFFDQMVTRVENLVAIGDIVTANDPDVNTVVVEDVALVDGGSAVLTICRVTNRKQVTPASNTPTGSEVLTAGTGELIASRARESVVLTANGRLRDASSESIGAWPGQDECSPA